jgi:hypothetical protein
MATAYTYIPNGRKTDQMAKYIPTSSAASPSKNYPNWDFWFESVPSGSPVYLAKEKSSSPKSRC